METTIGLWAPTTQKVEISEHDSDRVTIWLTAPNLGDLEVKIEDDGDELERWLADTYERVKDARRAREARRLEEQAANPGFPALRIWETAERLREERGSAFADVVQVDS